MKKIILLGAIFTAFGLTTNAQTKNKVPFVGKKYFEDKAYSTTYIVTIKSDGTASISAGGPGADNKGWTVYKGKYKPLMINKEEGVKIGNGFLYLLNKIGDIRKDCLDSDNNECPCKYSIKTQDLVK